MGRWVYTGIYEPEHPTADERGFRRTVQDAGNVEGQLPPASWTMLTLERRRG
jgi:hypothetical protein